MTPHQPDNIDDSEDPGTAPLLLSHFFDTLRRYSTVIVVSIVSIAIAYVLIAATIYLLAPTERISTQPFRLDFKGAAKGKFPNGLRFSTDDVVSATVILPVYRSNELQRYVSFADFSRSLFVLESNPAYESLSAEYQARLTDPKLSPLDRDRIEKEFQQRRDAIAKNEYSLNYSRLEGVRTLPEPLARKVLNDTLHAWSQHAISDQDVLAYPTVVLSPEVVQPTGTEKTNPMVAALMLRARTLQLLDNLTELQKLPGADLARGGPDRISLTEVRLRMEEVLRYRIEPLVARVARSRFDRQAMTRFMQEQLNYDQRGLTSAKERAESLRATLSVYEQTLPAPQGSIRSSTEIARPNANNETLMPQVSDSFIDRVIDLVGKSTDSQYRQQLVNDYREAAEAVIPIEQRVQYDNAILSQLTAGPSGDADDLTSIAADIEGSRAELRDLVGRANNVYHEISRNLYSTSQLLTLTAPPSVRVLHAVVVSKLVLWGVIVMLASVIFVVGTCLVHNRVREEEQERLDQPRVPVS